MAKAAAASAKRQLQVDGYTAFIRALAVNHLDWRHEKLMADVRKELAITAEQHLSIVEQVMTDPDITAIREGKPIPIRTKEPPVPLAPEPVAAQDAAPQAKGPLATTGPGRKRKDPPQALQPPSPAGIPPQQVFKPAKKGKKGGPTSSGPSGVTPPASPRAWIGRVVERLWGQTWLDAVVTDYDQARDLHCLTYEGETHEWYNVARPSREFRPTNRSISAADLPRSQRGQGGVPGSGGGKVKQDLPGDKRKLGRSGSGKYSSFNTMSEQALISFEATVQQADSEELGRLSSQVRKTEARVRAELIEIGASDDEDSEEAALQRLTREWDRLCRKETELRRELSTLED